VVIREAVQNRADAAVIKNQERKNMPNKAEVMAGLNQVLVPGIQRSLVEMNLVREVYISDHKVDVKLAAAAIGTDTQDWLKAEIQNLKSTLNDVKSINVSFEAVAPKDVNKIGHVIAIMSGKGGVGKSLISGLTAVTLRRQGYSVGILDADITGPSIPKMFGIHARPNCSDSGIVPLSSKSGIEVMSLNLLLNDENESVIWRGPIIGKVITQFWEEVLWGKLDYLIVDLPPGTADAPLTVLQQLPMSGIIIVSSPQDLATMIVKKAVHMVKQMKKPIIGVVENMSYLYLPDIDRKIEIFGKSKGEEMAQAAGAPLLAQFPIDPELARLCDIGEIESYSSRIMDEFGQKLAKVPLSCTPGKSDCQSCSHDCKA
jgi:ATP-binding protein involved in chromosome partitioning